MFEQSVEQWLPLVADVLQGKIGIQALREGLTRESPGEKRFMLKAQALAQDTKELAALRPQLKAALASMASPRARKACPTLDRYCQWYALLVDQLDGRMQRQSWRWAESFLAEHPDQALKVIDEWLSAQEVLALVLNSFNVPKERNGTKARRNDDPVLRAAHTVAASLLPMLTKAAPDNSLEAELLLLENLCGGARPLIKAALATLFNWLYVYCVSVVFTLEEDAAALIDPVQATVIDSMVAPNDSVFRAFDRLVFDLVRTLDPAPQITSWKRLISMMLDAGRALDDAFELQATRTRESSAQIKAQTREIAELKRQLSKGSPTDALLEKLRHQSDQIARLESRLAAEAARSEHYQRQIARLLEGAREVLPEPPPPEAPELPPPAVPLPRANYENDLAFLTSARVALIGGHPNFINKVKSLLPNWALFPATQKTVCDAEIPSVVAILCFTEYCGHPLFETATKIARTRGIPIRYVKKINPTAFIHEAAAQLRLL